MATSKLEAYRDEIVNRSRTDKEIAADAGVMTGAVRAYRKRQEARNADKAAAEKSAATKKPAVKRTKVELPKGVDKQCPKCGDQATGEAEIDKKFGFRNVKTKSGDKKRIPQSQCRSCRKASLKASKAKKVAEAQAAAAK